MSDPNSAATSELIEQIKHGDSQGLIDAARELAARQEMAAAPHLMEVLGQTNDATVRNAVALALSDLKYPAAFDALVDLLRNERTRGSRGTLLYALRAYDCSPILPLLIDFVIEGNFEVSREAHSLISGIQTELDESTWQSCVERLRSAEKVATEERRPMLSELLSWFEQER